LARALRIEPLERRTLLSATALQGGEKDPDDSTTSHGTRGASAAPESIPIYYDYFEDGVLKGGIVYADTSDPLQSPLGDLAGPPAAPWNVETVADNGAPDNRVDLVVLGDGYTASELNTYATNVTNLLPGFFSEPPLDEYTSFFNVHRVDVISRAGA